MSQEPLPKIFFENRCPRCYLVLSSARSLLNHMKSQHNVYMESRPASQSRPRDTTFRSVTSRRDATGIHLGCPSCWYHCPDNDLQSYTNHIEEQHLSKTWQEYVDLSQVDLSTRHPDDSHTDQARIAQENQIMDALAQLTDSFKNLFTRSK